MTRFLFGDDISQSARTIEESERLKSKFTARKQLPSWSSVLVGAEALLGEGPHGVVRLGTTPIATALPASG